MAVLKGNYKIHQMLKMICNSTSANHHQVFNIHARVNKHTHKKKKKKNLLVTSSFILKLYKAHIKYKIKILLILFIYIQVSFIFLFMTLISTIKQNIYMPDTRAMQTMQKILRTTHIDYSLKAF